MSDERGVLWLVADLMKQFVRDEEGLSAVEYAIAGALVIGVAAGAFVALGTNVDSRVETMAGCVQISI